MKKIYRSALGSQIDMDNLRLNNEATIAIGNMKVNARGDELGAGGRIAKPRNQAMNEYYKLNTPQVMDSHPLEADNTTIAVPPVVSSTPAPLLSVDQIADMDLDAGTIQSKAPTKGNLGNLLSKK